ncbi:DUF89 family protein [bacterium]|nr:DUF89 family protein [bacterium]
MKTYYECLSCIINQTIKNFTAVDKKYHDKILREVIAGLSKADYSLSPPELAKNTYEIINHYTGGKDAYAEIKKMSNQYILDLYDELKALIDKSDDPFETALHLAVAGNIIDFGAKHNYSDKQIHEEIEKMLTADLSSSHTEELRQEINDAKKILYLGDNAGEIVFDKLFVERLPKEKITFAVRGKPVINDATMEDAKSIGLTEIVKVIDNGSGYPGTVLQSCSESFKKIFSEADLIISKGQGNYETLSENKRNIFFLLKIKCDIVARDLNKSLGDFVVLKNNHE